MHSFRVTYHTTGGPFSRLIEAKDAEAAEKVAKSAIKAGSYVEFTENEIRFSIFPNQIAAISIEEEKAGTVGGERRTVGFAGR
ncbi:MAG: hypothetical protein QM758_29785 [Armatimonas sp.]